MIESVNEDNLADVLPLICAYQQFYNVADISEHNNRVFFSQFSENSPLGCQFLYRLDGKAVGFATVYFSFSSSILIPSVKDVSSFNSFIIAPIFTLSIELFRSLAELAYFGFYRFYGVDALNTDTNFDEE